MISLGEKDLKLAVWSKKNIGLPFPKKGKPMLYISKKYCTLRAWCVCVRACVCVVNLKVGQAKFKEMCITFFSPTS
jgi:hypothetical protein